MIDFLHVLLSRRSAEKPVPSDRRKKLMFPACKAANKTLQESLQNFDDAVTRAIGRKK